MRPTVQRLAPGVLAPAAILAASCSLLLTRGHPVGNDGSDADTDLGADAERPLGDAEDFSEPDSDEDLPSADAERTDADADTVPDREPDLSDPCPSGQADCGDGCIPLDTHDNCGGCGRRCADLDGCSCTRSGDTSSCSRPGSRYCFVSCSQGELLLMAWCYEELDLSACEDCDECMLTERSCIRTSGSTHCVERASVHGNWYYCSD